MPLMQDSGELNLEPAKGAASPPRSLRLKVVIDTPRLCTHLEWSASDPPHNIVARVTISRSDDALQWMPLKWTILSEAGESRFWSYANSSSIRSRLQSLRELFRAPDAAITGAALSVNSDGTIITKELTNQQFLPDPWREIARVIGAMGKLAEQLAGQRRGSLPAPGTASGTPLYGLRITIDMCSEEIRFEWHDVSGNVVASGRIGCTVSMNLNGR
jgi:hypothetical protein